MPSTAVDSPRPVAQADDQRNRIAIYGTPVSHSVAPGLFDVIFPAIGLPKHKYTAVDTPSLLVENNPWALAKEQPDFLGSCLTMPLKLQGMDKVDELAPQAQAIGSVNTTYVRIDEATGKAVHVGTNLDTAGVGNSLLTALLDSPSPFPADAPRRFAPRTAAALMTLLTARTLLIVGGGGATRAAIYAMNNIGLSPIFLINRDASETASIVAQFPDLDLRPLESVEQVQQELSSLEAKGVKLCAGTGAIPSIEPATAEEKNVYAVAKAAFEWPYKPESTQGEAGFLSLPQKPTFLEMAYKPRMTIMRGIAEKSGWKTICGVEVVLEGCFEQCKLWTGIEVPLEVREAGRKVLRAE
ncbi:hypothetical protein JCM10213v2_009095 [Rhodosporidiobolus nylandii]